MSATRQSIHEGLLNGSNPHKRKRGMIVKKWEEPNFNWAFAEGD
jgi:hypothetical protein